MRLCLLLALLIWPMAANADIVVRVERGDATALPPALNAHMQLDYGSYRLLRVDQDALAQLRRAGTPHSVIEDVDVISFGSHRFDPLQSEPLELAPRDAQGRYFQLVQWYGPPRQSDLDALRGAGLEPLQYYPGNAYLAWGNQTDSNATRALSSVRWVGDFGESLKPSSDLAKRSGVIENVAVQFINNGNVEQTLDALRNAGAQVLSFHAAQPDKRFYEAIVVVDAARLDSFARIAEVLWYGYQSPEGKLEDEMSSQIVAGNYAGGTPELGYLSFLSGLGYDGSGVTWAVTDSGVDLSHPEFVGRIAGGYTYPGCPAGNGPGDDTASGGHGTHVAGIVAGPGVLGLVDGAGFNYAIGVAPGAQVFAQNPICAAGVPWPPAGGWQELSKRALAGGAVGTNASWTTGEGANHGYQNSERTFDFIVRDGDFDTAGVAEQFYFVFSAGNSGPGASTLTAPKEAKNPIVVAASNNQRAGSIESIASFSSRGPSVDGRTFPTIAAPGATIASTRRVASASQCSTPIAGTSNQMSFCSGTSMAAPHVSGLGALLVQWWRVSRGPGGDPSPAMLKALMVNGAQDMANVATIPNNTEGWGRVHIPDTLAEGISRHYIDQTEILDDAGEVYELQVGVVDSGEPLRISLAWSDAPGAIGANPALVNDLDLEVEVNGQTYLGNVFSSGLSTTGGSADRLNNLENVFLSSASGGVTIRVRANTISADGVPFVGDMTDQDFALVCTNCAQNPSYTLNTSGGAQSVCAPDDAVFDLQIGSILGYTDPVTLSASGEPAGSSLSFSTNPVNPPGSSTLTISNTGAAVAGDYIIAVQADSTSGMQTRDLPLQLFTSAPAAPMLLTPADAADNQPVQPSFTWSEPTQSGSYLIEIADDPAFSNIIDSATVDSAEYTSAVLLNSNSIYYWRVSAANSCGSSASAPAFSFITAPAPGDCSMGDQVNTPFSTDFESGVGGWTTGGNNNSWQLSTTQANSGTTSWHANDPTSVSDQHLISPPIALPTEQSPLTLQFFHRRDIEENGSNCWDAGILEASTDGGANWNQILNPALLTDPYTGTVSGNTNPLAGLQGWCNLQDWTRAIVDVDALAGQTAQFRFRLGSDGSVGAEGWYVDDVKVQSCQDQSFIFLDGFE